MQLVKCTKTGGNVVLKDGIIIWNLEVLTEQVVT
jgi:hypothetical protein